jgi:site-specific DNA-methyltransferase (adenine-specific)
LSRTPLAFQGRNPDVLTCIANLSNDEVFTPPELANQMLDTLERAWAEAHDGDSIWGNSSIHFLDPFTKSGVFLREITKRLVAGLANEIPNLNERVDHILTNQVFGIAITELTGLLARRSLYCSKWANGKHSIAKSFDSANGNVWFERTEHDWQNDRCRFCRAGRTALDRGGEMESHAYAFIHTDDIKARIAELFGDEMQFDVVIGNPPYQLQSDGGTRDVPIYHHFVEQAKKLGPRYLMMVIPSRWMAGGLGLSDFRREMLSDKSIRELVDYPNAAEIFPAVGLNGGACYFLRDDSYSGPCNVSTVRAGELIGPTLRSLDEFDVLVRDARALEILRKVLARGEESVNSILARDKEFGWTSNFDGFRESERPGDIPLYYIRAMKRSRGFVARSDVPKSQHLIDTWKLLVPKVGSGRERERTGVDLVLGPPMTASSPSVCTQSFLFFYVDSLEQVESLKSYYSTRFFRFLVSLRKITQDATHSTYRWVPMQTWDRKWTDEDLYRKYEISDQEVAYIESMIRPMEVADGGTAD